MRRLSLQFVAISAVVFTATSAEEQSASKKDTDKPNQERVSSVLYN